MNRMKNSRGGVNAAGWLLLPLLAAAPGVLFAQSAAEPSTRVPAPEDLEEIKVEGSRIQEEQLSTVAYDAAKFGTQVQLISADEIDTGGFTNFGELASGLIRGANIGYSPDEGEFTIRIDGGSDRDTLLLLDGVPTFDRGTPLEDLWGATAIDPRMIQTVEILRGGQSLYFGATVAWAWWPCATSSRKASSRVKSVPIGARSRRVKSMATSLFL